MKIRLIDDKTNRQTGELERSSVSSLPGLRRSSISSQVIRQTDRQTAAQINK